MNTHAPPAAPPLELIDIDAAVPDEPTAPAEDVPRPRWRTSMAIVVVLGLLGVLGWSQLSSPDTPPPATDPAGTSAEIPIGLLGYAEMYVTTYLTAAGHEGNAELRRFYPAAPDAALSASSDRYVTGAVALGATPLAPDYWQVEVSARVLVFDGTGYQPDGTHHYLVAVSSAGADLVATTLPTRVALPPAPAVPVVAAGTAVEDEAVHALVDGFLGSLLAGGGDLRTYVGATSGLTPLDPPAFEKVEANEVASIATGNRTRHIRVQAVGTPFIGAPVALEYHLVVDEEGGAWRVMGLAAGPPTAANVEGEDQESDGDEPGDA